MVAYPKHPAMKAAAAVAQNGRDATRAHARLDNVESVSSKQTSDISTNAANVTTAQNGVNTNTTSITTLNSNLGSSAHQAFLGTLTQMAHISGAGGGFSHSGVGTLGSPPTASEFNSLNGAFNNLVDGVNNLVTIFNAVCSELSGGNYMA